MNRPCILTEFGYNSMARITNTILSSNIPNPQYKKHLNGRLTLTLITPNHPSRCVPWNYNPEFCVWSIESIVYVHIFLAQVLWVGWS